MANNATELREIINLLKSGDETQRSQAVEKLSVFLEDESQAIEQGEYAYEINDLFATADYLVIATLRTSQAICEQISYGDYAQGINAAFASGKKDVIVVLLSSQDIRRNMESCEGIRSAYSGGIGKALKNGELGAVALLLNVEEVQDDICDSYHNVVLDEILRSTDKPRIMLLLGSEAVQEILVGSKNIMLHAARDLINRCDPEINTALLKNESFHRLEDHIDGGLVGAEAGSLFRRQLNQKYCEKIEEPEPELQTAEPKNVGFLEKVRQFVEAFAWNFGR